MNPLDKTTLMLPLVSTLAYKSFPCYQVKQMSKHEVHKWRGYRWWTGAYLMKFLGIKYVEPWIKKPRRDSFHKVSICIPGQSVS